MKTREHPPIIQVVALAGSAFIGAALLTYKWYYKKPSSSGLTLLGTEPIASSIIFPSHTVKPLDSTKVNEEKSNITTNIGAVNLVHNYSPTISLNMAPDPAIATLFTSFQQLQQQVTDKLQAQDSQIAALLMRITEQNQLIAQFAARLTNQEQLGEQLPQKFVAVLEYLLDINLENAALVANLKAKESGQDSKQVEIMFRTLFYKQALEQGAELANNLDLKPLADAWLEQSSQLSGDISDHELS